jgi:hypothetical protein
MFRVIVRVNDIHWAVDYLLVAAAARNTSRSRVLNESNAPHSPPLHNIETQFEFQDGEINVNEPFYVCATILGHTPGWSVCKIGKNSPKNRPETVTLQLRDINDYWKYAEINEADPIQDVDEDWIYNQ